MQIGKLFIPSALAFITSLALVAGANPAQAKPPFLKPSFNAAAKAPKLKPQFNWAARKPAPISRGFNGTASGKPPKISKPFNNVARKPIRPRTFSGNGQQKSGRGTAGFSGPRFPGPKFRPGGF